MDHIFILILIFYGIIVLVLIKRSAGSIVYRSSVQKKSTWTWTCNFYSSNQNGRMFHRANANLDQYSAPLPDRAPAHHLEHERSVNACDSDRNCWKLPASGRRKRNPLARSGLQVGAQDSFFFYRCHIPFSFLFSAELVLATCERTARFLQLDCRHDLLSNIVYIFREIWIHTIKRSPL
jgi:hypothetical protein